MINNVLSPLKIKTHAKKPNQCKYAFIIRPSSLNTLFFKTDIPFLSPKTTGQKEILLQHNWYVPNQQWIQVAELHRFFFSNFVSAVFTRQLVIQSHLYIPCGEYMSYFLGASVWGKLALKSNRMTRKLHSVLLSIYFNILFKKYI